MVMNRRTLAWAFFGGGLFAALILVGLSLFTVCEPDGAANPRTILAVWQNEPYQMHTYASLAAPFCHTVVPGLFRLSDCGPSLLGYIAIGGFFLMIIIGMVMMRTMRATESVPLLLRDRVWAAVFVLFVLIDIVLSVVHWRWFNSKTRDNGWVRCVSSSNFENFEIRCPKCNQIVGLQVVTQNDSVQAPDSIRELKERVQKVYVGRGLAIHGSQMRCRCGYFIDLPNFLMIDLAPLKKSDDHSYVSGNPYVPRWLRDRERRHLRR